MKFLSLMLIGSFLGSWSMACDKGCVSYEGVCACEAPRTDTDYKMPAEWVSNEAPPRSGMPAWQSPNVHVVDAPNLTTQVANEMLAEAQAIAEGKKAAGIKENPENQIKISSK